MAAITVDNFDWTILNAAKSALAAATISGADVFNEVGITTSVPQFREQHMADTPIAAVRYRTTVEDDSPEGERGGHVACEIIVAARVNVSAADTAARIQEGLRLKNAAMNAIEGTPPSAAGYGDGDHFHLAIEWGNPTVDVDEAAPWAVVTIPVEFGYTLSDSTSH